MTFDDQSPVSLPFGPSGHLCQTWRNSLKAFQRFRFHHHETEVRSHWPLTSSYQFIFKSKRMFVSNLKTFPPGVPEIMCLQRGDGQPKIEKVKKVKINCFLSFQRNLLDSNLVFFSFWYEERFDIKDREALWLRNSYRGTKGEARFTYFLMSKLTLI